MATISIPGDSVLQAATGGMSWSDRFLLGYTAMDDTHREFVDRVAALECATDAELPARLAEFAQHAVEHFEQEEQWMSSSSFPAAQCHADEHAAVLRSVREVEQMLRDGAAIAIVRELTKALADWFPAHADYMDAALSHWMSKRTHGGLPVVLRRGVASPSGESTF
jgi:hemerythrin